MGILQIVKILWMEAVQLLWMKVGHPLHGITLALYGHTPKGQFSQRPFFKPPVHYSTAQHQMNKLIVRISAVMLGIACLLTVLPATAQPVYTIQLATANIHIDGSPAARPLETVKGEAQFGFTQGTSKQLNRLHHMHFSIGQLVTEDSNGIRNANSIDYLLTGYTILPQANGSYLLLTQGLLTMDGIAQKAEMDIYAYINSNGSITCRGSYSLNKATTETLDFMVTYQIGSPYL